MFHNCTAQISWGGGGNTKKAVATLEMFHTVLQNVAANKHQQPQPGQKALRSKKCRNHVKIFLNWLSVALPHQPNNTERNLVTIAPHRTPGVNVTTEQMSYF